MQQQDKRKFIQLISVPTFNYSLVSWLLFQGHALAIWFFDTLYLCMRKHYNYQ